jgi:mono/diheme cytochrome c family protein/DNA-binding beta-propeller fold protein YncE
MRRSLLVLVPLALAALAACKKETPVPPPASSGSAASIPSPAVPSSPPIPLDRVGEARSGSALVLARLGTKKVALVADDDANTLRVLDVAAKEEIASLPIAGRPAQMVVTREGKLLVLLRDESAMAVVEAHKDGSLRILERIQTSTEPVALALAPDERTAWVASGFAHALEGFDLATKKRVASFDVEREPRAVLVSQDGTHVFVAHGAAGVLETVDLLGNSKRAIDLGVAASAPVFEEIPDFEFRDRAVMLEALVPVPDDVANAKRVPPPVRPPPPPPPLDRGMGQRAFVHLPARFARQGFALVEVETHDAKGKSLGHRLILPHAQVMTGDPRRISTGYGGGGIEGSLSLPTNQFTFSVMDATSGERKEMAQGAPLSNKETCQLPRAAVVANGVLFTACLGSDAVQGFSLKGESIEPSARVKVPVPTPNALAFDPEAGRVFALSSFDRSITEFDVSGGGRSTIHLSGKTSLSELQLEGRKLFHDAGDPRIAADGRSCSSCHPDGRDDGLTWSTPNGPRQTIQLAGRINRPAPFGWMGKHASLQIHMTQTMQNLKGTGLAPRELDALAAYLNVMKGAPQKWRALTAEEARGKDLFASSDTGCSGCHGEKTGFSDHEVHDVKSATETDVTGQFLVPSLVGVAGSAPYFHDGRYASLEELLAKTDGTMGTTKSLTPEDKKALVAYLKTL